MSRNRNLLTKGPRFTLLCSMVCLRSLVFCCGMELNPKAKSSNCLAQTSDGLDKTSDALDPYEHTLAAFTKQQEIILLIASEDSNVAGCIKFELHSDGDTSRAELLEVCNDLDRS